MMASIMLFSECRPLASSTSSLSARTCTIPGRLYVLVSYSTVRLPVRPHSSMYLSKSFRQP